MANQRSSSSASLFPKPPRQSDGETLRLGAISFINTLPMYHQGLVLPEGVTLHYAPPATLNQWMLEGRLDMSPVSSAFYLAHTQRFTLQPGLSVSSFGGVESVLFLTRPNIHWPTAQIVVPDDSATSVAVLKALLAKQYPASSGARFTVVPAADITQALILADGGLVIGDRALAIYCQYQAGTLPAPLNTYLIHDLATEWAQHYHCPLVFAVWIAHNTLPPTLNQRRTQTLQALWAARDLFFNQPSQQQVVAQQALQQSSLHQSPLPYTQADVLRYWTQALNFDFGPQHQEGLKCLGQILSQPSIGVLPQAVRA